MVKFEGDLTDGPKLDTNDPSGSIMSIVGALVGFGLLFAVISAAQSTTAPMFKSVMNMIPGVSTGNDGTAGIRVG